MRQMPYYKYRPFHVIDMPYRTWPSNTITKAPKWCSVDLRDGNQALIVPMSIEEKIEMFNLLVSIGFKEIEVGFPSASQVEFDFLRKLVEENLIPEDVTVQVLTQAREPLIKKTFESLKGAKRAIVHMYNSTSTLQRRVVFRMDRNEIISLAVKGAQCIKSEADKIEGADIIYEYSPESFTGTELDFALEICEAVIGVFQPSPEKKMIINLPSTVEMATPNVYADQIEWFCRHLKSRESVVISAHAHNDRGTAVAATELAIMAGAERVEGTLFGNGERTGNVDILTLAMNMFSQGIDTGLDFSDINKIAGVYERCTKIPVHIRHPYAGDLVYTAFSGSHQDAINKGMKAYKESGSEIWEVPYLPIDPSDVGRTYESVIRINSQSGKGGVAYIMEKEHGFLLPKEMHGEFGAVIQTISDGTGREIMPSMIWEAFEKEYLLAAKPLTLIKSSVREKPVKDGHSEAVVEADISIDGSTKRISGNGNGPIDAFSNALKKHMDIDFRLASYYEHALSKGSDSKAAAYIKIERPDGRSFFGVGVDENIDTASFKALISALNRSLSIKGETK
jgi:2-isopropylmalate synthase